MHTFSKYTNVSDVKQGDAIYSDVITSGDVVNSDVSAGKRVCNFLLWELQSVVHPRTGKNTREGFDIAYAVNK